MLQQDKKVLVEDASCMMNDFVTSVHLIPDHFYYAFNFLFFIYQRVFHSFAQFLLLVYCNLIFLCD